MKKISIVTITYNSEKTLEATIKSVVRQNYPMLEYIIIDGGSKDGTLEIVNRYKEHISYVVSEPDNGISDAFNKGIKAATGDVIGIINSDDMLYDNALFAINEAFEADSELDVVHGNVVRFNDGESRGRVAKPQTDMSLMKYQFPIYHPTTFVAKKAYEKHGIFSVEYKNAMDYELLSKMYYNGAKFGYSDNLISCFRLGGISQTAKKRTLIEHEKIALRNGATSKEIKKHLTKMKLVGAFADLIIKLRIEKIVRKILQNPQYVDLPDVE